MTTTTTRAPRDISTCCCYATTTTAHPGRSCDLPYTYDLVYSINRYVQVKVTVPSIGSIGVPTQKGSLYHFICGCSKYWSNKKCNPNFSPYLVGEEGENEAANPAVFDFMFPADDLEYFKRGYDTVSGTFYDGAEHSGHSRLANWLREWYMENVTNGKKVIFLDLYRSAKHVKIMPAPTSVFVNLLKRRKAELKGDYQHDYRRYMYFLGLGKKDCLSDPLNPTVDIYTWTNVLHPSVAIYVKMHNIDISSGNISLPVFLRVVQTWVIRVNAFCTDVRCLSNCPYEYSTDIIFASLRINHIFAGVIDFPMVIDYDNPANNVHNIELTRLRIFYDKEHDNYPFSAFDEISPDILPTLKNTEVKLIYREIEFPKDIINWDYAVSDFYLTHFSRGVDIDNL